MPCYYPLTAYELDGLKQNGKKKIVFSLDYYAFQKGFRTIQLPCGQCIGCRLLRSVQWAIRCEHEALSHKQNCFITLTYADKHLPTDHSLHKKHFQNFLKRFRRAIVPKKIRFLMCGEYSPDWRPHYHAIIFGYDFTEGMQYKGQFMRDRYQVQMSETGNPYYLSPLLSALWPVGYHIITNFTFDTAAYVARYCTKKITGEKADHHYNRMVSDLNLVTGEMTYMNEVQLTPEYGQASLKPGIGADWFEKYQSDCYPSNYLVRKGHKLPIPKYYDVLLEREDETLLAAVKQQRELAMLERAHEFTPERLKEKRICKEAQYKTLQRNKAR